MKKRMRKVELKPKERAALHWRAFFVGACFFFSILFGMSAGMTGFAVAGSSVNNSSALGIIFFVFGLVGTYELLGYWKSHSQ